MKAKRFIKEFGSRLAFFCAALALLLFIPAGLTQNATLRVLLGICILLLLIGGCVLLYLSGRYNGRGKTVHYFLYDHRRKTVLPRETLSEETVGEAIDRYVSEYCEDTLSLLGEVPKPLRMQLDMEPQFRPLVAYRVFSLLACGAQADVLSLFLAADSRAIAYFCRTLSECGDTELADYIYRLKRNAERESGRIPLFFQKNQRRFATRALHFVEQNFDKYYVDTVRFS